ncbi:rhodanese-like domain-containing protein [Pseudocolwellia sp. AS88]|uniref:rhodanese-like domain-containing protein n=1 Tax=Pseudocolwellia TaxID=2848177 RepID=UPI0026E9230F|nr:rhodanese-like domain-containing protein [Pseudocolwellia sp. AS88]MDO7084251.1 rhodanese-like domain-containing protein [Pseudocolwellia sp. AS88]
MLIKKLLTVATFISISIFSANIFAAQTPIISQDELVKLMSSQDTANFIVLDVRTAEEFNQGHIKNAINISHNSVADNLSLLAQHKDKMIVVHCRSGRRAIVAESVLQDNGFLNVRHLEGDMNAWVKAKLPLIKQ